MNLYTQSSPLQKIQDPEISRYGVNLYVKRDDLLDPEISGNKWRKIKYNLLEAKAKGFNTILSFGGAYSNHIYALAAACNKTDLKSIGVIRGEKTFPLNHTLKFAESRGMKLLYVSRAQYKMKEEEEFIEFLNIDPDAVYYLPEGGTNSLALEGCAEIANEIEVHYDYLCCPCGTGGTVSGISLTSKGQVLGFCVLKGVNMLDGVIDNLLKTDNRNNWSVNYDYHFGGYAKINRILLDFITTFKNTNGIELEPIYTGKMMFGIFDLIKQGYFKKGETVIALHTGGLQAWKGLMPKVQKIKREFGSDKF